MAWAQRINDARLLTGRASYVGDVNRPGQLYMCVVRSEYAHARIKSVATEEAIASPGVHAVLTAADLPTVPRIPVRTVSLPIMTTRLQPVIAVDRVRYVGEPIAVVVADDPYLAEDAADLMSVEAEALDVSVDPTTDVVPLWCDGADNVLAEFRATNGDVDSAFAEAAVVVEHDFRVQRQTGSPMETRGLVAEWEEDGTFLNIWGATKFLHWTRKTVAEFFGLDPDRVICHRVDVGGGFGSKGEVYPEDFLVPWAARVTGHPVKWGEDRREHLITMNQCRDHRHRFAVAASADGKLLAFRAESTVDVGAYPRPIGGRLTQNTVGSFPGPYHWKAFDAHCRGIASNKTPSGTMRAPSSCEAIFVMERSLDMLATKLDIDPLELRRRNLIPADDLPLTIPMGDEVHSPTYDSGDYPAQLQQFLDIVDYRGLVADLDRRRQAGELVGHGIAMFVDHSGMGKEETVSLELDVSGRFVLGTSATDMGQGIEDMAARVLAGALEVGDEDVSVLAGATAAHEGGVGTYASRTTIFVGSATQNASRQLLDEAAIRASEMLHQPPEALERTAAGFTAAGESVSWKELAPIKVIGKHSMEEPTHGFGIQLAVVCVDPGSAAVRVERVVVGYDAGTVIDPPSAHGQLQGGAAMGVAGCLFEALLYDEAGQPLATSFIDYVLPTCAEMPVIETHIFEMAPVSGNPLGAKGVGEAGIKGLGPAVANAVANAIGPAAADAITELPLRAHALAELMPLDWLDEFPEPPSAAPEEPATGSYPRLRPSPRPVAAWPAGRRWRAGAVLAASALAWWAARRLGRPGSAES